MTLNDIDTYCYCDYFYQNLPLCTRGCNTNDPGCSFFDESSLKILICALKKQQTLLAAPKPPRTHSELRRSRESCRPRPCNPTPHNDVECPGFRLRYTVQVFQVLQVIVL